MNEMTGIVVQQGDGFRFINDEDQLPQRLTTAALGGDIEAGEIDLSPYVGQRLTVTGDWEREWIMSAQIVSAAPA